MTTKAAEPQNPGVRIELLRSRSLGLIGALAAEDRDQLIEAKPLSKDFSFESCRKRLSISLASDRLRRSQASCTASSASVSEPSMR